MRDEDIIRPVLQLLDEAEGALDVSVGRYVKARARYRWHAWRRRRARVVEEALFCVAEAFGRVIADVRDPWHCDRLGTAARDELTALMEPGDVLVTRHDRALSNLFLPGYWPHAALHVGLPSEREQLGVEVDAARAQRWVDPLRVLEARKDGVLLRAIEDTLAVDAVAVLRPRVDGRAVARAISNAVVHEGKLYNFDFDFFADDRLVCTEVVYRAYEGVGGIQFELQERYGRPTLTAEDLIALATDARGFEAVAVFGTPGVGARLVRGEKAREALRMMG